MIRQILASVKNLWYWLPVVWRDRQWDYDYLFILLEHKLSRMEEFYSTVGGQHKVANRIHYCRCLCTRLVEDRYLYNSLRYHKKQWGEARIIWNENVLSDIAVPKLYGWAREEEKRIRNRLYKEEDRQREQDLEQLFLHLRKYVRTWWD